MGLQRWDNLAELEAGDEARSSKGQSSHGRNIGAYRAKLSDSGPKVRIPFNDRADITIHLSSRRGR